MIERVRIRNYKALRDVTVDLGRINVLIGPNDSGKTSFLEAVGAMCRSVDVPLAGAFAGAWVGPELHTDGDPTRAIEIEVTVRSDAWTGTYAWTCECLPRRRELTRSREYVIESTGPERDLYPKWSGPRTAVQVALHDGHVLPGVDVSQARHMAAALGPVATYRFEPAMLALPAASDSSRRFNMDPSGFGLALCLDNILGYDREAFGRIEAAMRRVFPEFRALRLIPQSAYRAPYDPAAEVPSLQKADGKGLQFLFAGRRAAVPASQASDGVLLVLAYLTALSLPEPARLVLIEEPENGIHPRRLKEVLGFVRDFVREQSETQVILTSHSPYVVDLFEPSEVYACRKTDEAGVVIQRLSDSPLVRDQIRHFTLGEIWVSEGEDRLVTVPAPAQAPKAPAEQVAEDGPATP